MKNVKRNIPMIVALSIPVLMIVLITVSIYVPALFVKPQIDFVYSTGWDYCDSFRFTIQNEQIVTRELKNVSDNNTCRNYEEPRIFYYDVQENTTKEMTFEEAQQLRVDKRLKSPDGFEVVSGNHSFDLFFDGSSYYDQYLKKGTFSRRIKLERKYYYNFNFLGWVKE